MSRMLPPPTNTRSKNQPEKTWVRFFGCMVLFSLLLCTPGLADTGASYTILYTIGLHDDGSALWSVEYRTPLATQAEQESFEQTINSSPEFSGENIRSLMQTSAEQASLATGRPMSIENFTSSVAIQNSPTGTYGVVRYAFTWTGFAKSDAGTLTMGDAFAEGLYLPSGATLVIQVPEDYSVTSTRPVSESSQGDVVWYGPESFNSGEPQVTLTKAGIPFLMIGSIVLGIVVLGGILFFVLGRRKSEIPVKSGDFITEDDDFEEPVETCPAESPAPQPYSDSELRSVEEKVLRLLIDQGGEVYQSDIVQQLALPKSTVSSALNGLHTRGIIVKVKKGRENLIRLSNKEQTG